MKCLICILEGGAGEWTIREGDIITLDGSTGAVLLGEVAMSAAGLEGSGLDELLGWADLILVMSPGHLLRLTELGVVGKAAVLDAFAQGEEGSGEGADVPDPFGGDDDYYEEAYRTIEELVGKVLHQLEPILAP